MENVLVLTILGEDRPGLVESVASVIAGHGGSWLESRMARLAGKFAGILRASVPSERCAALADDLHRLEGAGLRVIVEQADGGPSAPPMRTFNIELVGDDHPGIVRDISRALAAHGVNVEELHTAIASAPMSGEMLFKAHARLAVPPTVSVDALRAEIERLAVDLIVEIDFAEAAEVAR